MIKKIIKSKKAPRPIGPYNQAVCFGNGIYISGQIPISLETGDIVEGGIQGQTQQVLQYIEGILTEAGATLDHIVKTTVFLSSMDNFVKMNEVYADFFKEDIAPARATIEVSRLPKDVLVEIDAVAFI